MLIIAGGKDEIVPFEENAGKLIKYCEENAINMVSIVKPDCKHHSHSLEDVAPIIEKLKFGGIILWQKADLSGNIP